MVISAGPSSGRPDGIVESVRHLGAQQGRRLLGQLALDQVDGLFQVFAPQGQIFVVDAPEFLLQARSAGPGPTRR
jgi:hypothetical protein